MLLFTAGATNQLSGPDGEVGFRRHLSNSVDLVLSGLHGSAWYEPLFHPGCLQRPTFLRINGRKTEVLRTLYMI